MRTNVNDFALTSIEETQKAIQIVKKRIELREQILEERVLQLPKEVLKAGVSMIIPAFINSKITGRSWNLIKDSIGLLSPFSSNKASLFTDLIKQVGIIGLLKTIISVLFKKEEVPE